MSIYVEILIRGGIDELWRRTQQPELHEQWDLRFTRITYLPRADESHPQQFQYATRIGFGLSIEGAGESTGSKADAAGTRTSALRFWSDDPKSLIREGAGYWQYSPLGDQVRFVTSYDYRVRFGWLGRALDRLAFRPLIAWATAWSFDRLRLWIETGVDPRSALRRWGIYHVARLAVAFVWLYQGAVPKLISHHSDELALVVQQGLPSTLAPTIVTMVGYCEVLFGALILLRPALRWPLRLSIVLMVAATIAVAAASPIYLLAAFNPVSLNLAVVALWAVALIAGTDLPSARRVIWTANRK